MCGCPARQRAMGLAGTAGSACTRYLVFFQYLGTDFKYVFPLLPPAPSRRAGGKAGSGSGTVRMTRRDV